MAGLLDDVMEGIRKQALGESPTTPPMDMTNAPKPVETPESSTGWTLEKELGYVQLSPKDQAYAKQHGITPAPFDPEKAKSYAEVNGMNPEDYSDDGETPQVSGMIDVTGIPRKPRTSLQLQRNGDQIINPDEAIDRSVAVLNKADSVASKRDELVQTMDEDLQSIQSQQVKNLTAKTKIQGDILEEQDAATQELKRKADPLFEARSETQQNLQKIREENPLVAGLKGIFDLRYNEKYQKDQMERVDTEIASEAKQFDFYDSIQNKLLGIAEKGYALEDSVLQLGLQHSAQDFDQVNREWAVALDDVQLLGQEISQNNALVSSRILARNEVLDQMSHGEANKLMQAARKNGGFVEHNGVKLSEAQIKEQAQKRESEGLRIEQARLALQTARTQNSRAASAAAEESQGRALRSMSRSRVMAIATNGGKDPQTGMQFDIRQVTSMVQGFQNNDQLILNDVATAQGVDGYVSTMNVVANKMKTFAITAGTTGTNDPRLVSGAQSVGKFSKDSRARMAKAKAMGPEAYRIQAIKETQAAQQVLEGFNSSVKSFAESKAGGDKHLANGLFGFMTGTDISAEDANGAAAAAAVYGNGAREFGSTPGGLAALNKARAVAAEIKQEYRGKKLTKGTLAKLVKERLMDEGGMADAMVGQAMPGLIQSTGKIARQQGHAFGEVEDSTITAAYNSSMMTAINDAASRHEVSATTVQAILAGKPAAGVDKAIRQSIEQRVQAVQMPAFMTALDKIHPNTSDRFQPSRAFVSLMNSSQTQQAFSNYENGISRLGFGNFLTSQASGGVVGLAVGQYADSARDTYGKLQASQHMAQQGAIGNMLGNPKAQQNAILAAVGLNARERKALIEAANEMVNVPAPERVNAQTPTGDYFSSKGQFTNPGATANYSDQLKDAMLNSQFQDKALQKIQRKAVAGYDQAELSVSRAFESAQE